MKKNVHLLVFSLTSILNVVVGFGGSEEKFIKRYAMMKVYESCFGSQVLNEIRREMKEAAQKCTGMASSFDDKYFTKDGNNIKQTSNSEWAQDSALRLKPTSGTKVKKPIHTTDTLLLQQWTEEQKQSNPGSAITIDQDLSETESTNSDESESVTPGKKPVDFSKLEEAIMNIGKPTSSVAMQKPGSGNSNFQQSAAVGYYPPMYYPPPVPFAPSYPYHPYYPSYFQAAGPAGTAAFQSFYRSGLRAAKITNFSPRSRKSSDARSQPDFSILQYGSKVRNISCIMQELGYLDEHLEPNYAKMSERINRLYIAEDLKRDMLDGVKFCRQFSQCVPETRKDSFQLSKELLRPMFFFRCYKHKKLESCIMKDIRERFSQSTSEFNNEVRRSFRNIDFVGTMLESVLGSGQDSDYDDLF